MERSSEVTYADLVRYELWEPFVQTRAKLKETTSTGPDTRALLEIADTVVYDETTCSFYQVHPGVPVPTTRQTETIRFPMDLKDVRALTEGMAQHL